MSAPSSVVAVSLSALLSGAWALIQGSAGLVLFELDGIGGGTAMLLGLIQIGCGLGMLAGKNGSRLLYLWFLGIGFFVSWFALYELAHAQDTTFAPYAASGLKVFLACWFTWYLTGPKAMPFFVPELGHGHGDHGHGAHA